MVKSPRRATSRIVLAVVAAVALLGVIAAPAQATKWVSECSTIPSDRDRCGYTQNADVAAQTYYNNASGERQLCVSDRLADGHSAAVRYRPYGSTSAWTIKWEANGYNTTACTAGRPGAAGTRWTIEACIGEFTPRTLLSCDDLKVITL